MLLPSSHLTLPLLSLALLAGSSSAKLSKRPTPSSSSSSASLRNSDQWRKPFAPFDDLFKNFRDAQKYKEPSTREHCAELLLILEALPKVTAENKPSAPNSRKSRIFADDIHEFHLSAVKLRNRLQKVLSQEVRSLCEALPNPSNKRSKNNRLAQHLKKCKNKFAAHIFHAALLANALRIFPVEDFKEIFLLLFWRSATSLLRLSLVTKVKTAGKEMERDDNMRPSSSAGNDKKSNGDVQGGWRKGYKTQFTLSSTTFYGKHIKPLPARVLDAIAKADDEYSLKMLQTMREKLLEY